MPSKQQEEAQNTGSPTQKEKEVATCPLCGNRMVFLQACHLRCNNCGSELSCEDMGWFWG